MLVRLVRILTLGTLFTFFTPSLLAQSQSENAMSPADSAEIEHCQLTLENLARYYAASADLKATAKPNPALTAKLNASAIDIPTRTAAFASEPVFLAALARHGFTPRQYTVEEFTVTVTVIVLAAKQEGASASDIAALHVAPANLALFEQHGAEIAALQAKNR